MSTLSGPNEQDAPDFELDEPDYAHLFDGDGQYQSDDDHEDDFALYIPTWFRGSVTLTVAD